MLNEDLFDGCHQYLEQVVVIGATKSSIFRFVAPTWIVSKYSASQRSHETNPCIFNKYIMDGLNENSHNPS
jgi:hypothetical protein